MKLKDLVLKLGDSPSPVPTLFMIVGVGAIAAGTFFLLTKRCDSPETIKKKVQDETAADAPKDGDESVVDAYFEESKKKVAEAVESAKFYRKKAIELVKSGIVLTVVSDFLRRMALDAAYSKYQELKLAGRKLVRERSDHNDCLKQALYTVEKMANDMKKNPATFEQGMGMQNAYCTIYSATDPKNWRVVK